MTAITLSRDLKKAVLFAAIAAVPLSAAAQSMRYERIDYPRAVQTLITGVNDDGTIIGTYTLGELPACAQGNGVRFQHRDHLRRRAGRCVHLQAQDLFDAPKSGRLEYSIGGDQQS
jgi:hypothetical protein